MKNVSVILISLILFSCSSSRDVVHSGFLQKRKYNKGFHLSKKNKVNKTNNEENLASFKLNENIKSELKNEDVTISKNNKSKKETLYLESLKNKKENEEKVLASNSLKDTFFSEFVSVYEKQWIKNKEKSNDKESFEEKVDEDRKGLSLLGLSLVSLGLVTLIIGVIINIQWIIAFSLVILLVGVVLKAESKKPKKGTEAYKLLEEKKQRQNQELKEEEFSENYPDLQATEGDIFEGQISTVHNSKEQKNLMLSARVSRGVGLGLIFGIITIIFLPITYLLFLISVGSLISYTKNRINDFTDIDLKNAAIEAELIKVKRKLKRHNILLLSGLLLVILVGLLAGISLELVIPFVVLGVIAFIWFLVNLVDLAVDYFNLFKLVKQEDKIGRKYKEELK